MSAEFSVEQKRYLEGFVSGVQAGRTAHGLKPLGAGDEQGAGEPTGPDAAHLKAQDATKAKGKKLVDQMPIPVVVAGRKTTSAPVG